MAYTNEDVAPPPEQRPDSKVKLPNDETVKKFRDEAASYYNRFQTDRQAIDVFNKIADYMYACAQNRTIMSAERASGINTSGDTRSNVGSPLFFRQINTLASLYTKVMRSRPVPWEYSTIGSESVTGSMEDSKERADQANVLALWTLKQDEWPQKLPEHAVHTFKYSNVMAMIYWKRTFKRVLVAEPTVQEIPQPDGTVQQVITGESKKYVNALAENRPCVWFPHVDSVYMDRWLGDTQSQNCVVVLRLRNRSEIYGDVLNGFYSEDQYNLITNQHEWNGQHGAALKTLEAQNRQTTFNAQGTKMFLEWTVMMRAPIEESSQSWDMKNPPLIWVGSFIGNTIADGICMQIRRNFDPDDEFPLKDIHVFPDKSDTLYHTTTAEVVRSSYSADCTLLNMAMDNMANVNDPPMTVIDGQHRISDFTFRKGQRWVVDRHEALKTFDVRDNTLQTVNLRRQVQDDAKQALSTDAGSMGEYAGARTSASEFLSVNDGTKNPQLLQIGYVVGQLCPWLARKFMSYWKAYGLPEQVIRISNQGKLYEINPTEVAGEYDVVVNIVDEFEDNIVKQQQANAILQTIGNVPYFQQSQHHSTDPGELLKVWLRSQKWDSSRIVLPASGVDAEYVARGEIATMLYGGTYVKPVLGQNLPVHLRVEKAELLRWQGLEGIDDPRAKNIPLLQQHVAEEEQMMQSQGANPGTLPAPPGNQTPGEVVGNEAAAALAPIGGGSQ